jgi:serine/threonine protein kinase
MPGLDASTLVSGAPKPGDLVASKYRVDRTLGSGGMGVVLEATHLELEQRVAIKLLLPHVAQSQESVGRFLREARSAAKIKSDHVVRVLDVARLESGSPYIVMEFLEGQDLAELVADKGPLPVPLAVDYLLQACEAIAEAHALGIVHRDLKPANLFLVDRPGATPLIKVLDFGISKEASRPIGQKSDAITTTTAILGTPSYMSPEQMRSTRDVDGRADIWSLGAILFALLKGEPPYQGESTADVCAKIMRDPPPPLSPTDAPPGVAYAVARCLEKAPDKRFESVAMLAAALVEFGSPAARASLAQIGSLPAPRSRIPSSSFESDPTALAHVVVSPRSASGTRGTWERTPTTGATRTRPSIGVVLGILMAAILGGIISLQIWGGKPSPSPVSTATTPIATATPTSPTASPSPNVPSIDVTALPLAAAPSSSPTLTKPTHPKPSHPEGDLFDGRK